MQAGIITWAEPEINKVINVVANERQLLGVQLSEATLRSWGIWSWNIAARKVNKDMINVKFKLC